ncbi:class I SAM-dependent methyltransferase [Lichenibacterium ramalinae]|uniref:class I SAM-dependent methyltransferase n=1 Tax=Lichenibacterium ramalinae TaxID=2316527 RepID=UPI001FDF6435|nr:class I SAM-dependent methyltransferase [Lichenibacterium ramalinae]
MADPGGVDAIALPRGAPLISLSPVSIAAVRGFGRPPAAAPVAAYAALVPLFAAALPSCAALLAAAETYAYDIARIARASPDLVGERPARFTQEWFPRLDAVAAYTLVRQARPARILEIGCGHSSRFMAQAIVDGGLSTAMTCVDPRPRAPLAGLPVRHAQRPFGEADVAAAAAFAPGDIVFVDSSHVVVPGNEVDRLLLDVLPRLPAGVLVHFHDIFLPFGYPDAWETRRYNEQTAVGALLGGGGYEIVFASRYVATATDLIADTLVADLPLAGGAPEASLWLRKRAGRR